MTQARLEGGGHDPARLQGRNQPKSGASQSDLSFYLMSSNTHREFQDNLWLEKVHFLLVISMLLALDWNLLEVEEKRYVYNIPVLAPWPPMGVLSMGLEHCHRRKICMVSTEPTGDPPVQSPKNVTDMWALCIRLSRDYIMQMSFLFCEKWRKQLFKIYEVFTNKKNEYKHNIPGNVTCCRWLVPIVVVIKSSVFLSTERSLFMAGGWAGANQKIMCTENMPPLEVACYIFAPPPPNSDPVKF